MIWIFAIGLTLLFTVPYVLKHMKREKNVEAVYQKSLKRGLEEPDTLHPVIDPNACICTGNCIAVCPEKDVLGLLGGTALSINPTKCVGHGLCERACPVDAIQLVVGTSKRGVDIPRIQENYETNIPGMFVIGELGGMGLIRNAFEQARQCLEGIVKENRPAKPNQYDVVVIGCGPAGLAASLYCEDHGLRYVTLEKEDIGGTVRYYPRKKVVMTQPLIVPGYGKLDFKQIVKEDLIATWENIVERTNIGAHIRTREAMQAIERDGEDFVVRSDKGEYRTKRVVLAIGRRGVPRKLGIEGEESAKVSYSLLEPEHFQQNRVMIVGGGDTAIEAAVALSQQPGNEVTLSYRREQFNRIKAGNQHAIEVAFQEGRVRFMPHSALKQIQNERVVVEDTNGRHEIPNDYTFIMIGGTLPTAMLEEIGIEIDKKFGEPPRG